MQHENMQLRFLGILIGIALTLLSTAAALADDEVVTRFNFGGGGKTVESGALRLRGAVNQPLGGSVQNSSSGALLCTGFECGEGVSASSTPTSTPTPSSDPTDIVINEVFYLGDSSTDWIELKNTGAEPIDISDWWFCSRFSYVLLSELTQTQGDDLTLDPGEIIVLASWTDLNNTAADLGLYRNDENVGDGRPSFDDEDFMVDFVQWGTSEDIGRSDVAARKGIWPEVTPGVYDFVPTASNGESVALRANNKGTASVDFGNREPTQGTNNSTSSSSLSVDAGPSQSISLSSEAALDGNVSGTPTSLLWTKVSGPGDVTFGDPNSVDTTASFSVGGTYVLRLTAQDASSEVFDEVTVTVESSSSSSLSVNAGSSQTVSLSSGAVLDGTITGSPTSTTWSVTSGPGTVTFGDPNSVDTTASFSAGGTYVLRLTAQDASSEVFDEVTITVNTSSSSDSDKAVYLPFMSFK